MSFEDWPGDIEMLVDDKAQQAVYDNEDFIRNVAETVVDESDIDGRVQDYIDNNLDITDEVENAIRYRGFTSDEIEDFDSAVQAVVEYCVGDIDTDEIEGLRAEVQELRSLLNKVAKVLTGEVTTVSLSAPVPAFGPHGEEKVEQPEFIGVAI